MSNPVVPYISADQRLPEITFKAVVLSIILTFIMAGANAYLVLKAGLSISACIPAAVISMAVLKMFKNSNILENNIVQTTASAGESIAAALAFTLPALVMIGYWNDFPFIATASITAVGGILGVLLSVPLRRAMIVEGELPFPEGVATAEVLKTGDNASDGGAQSILFGGIAAAVVKFFQDGFHILADSINVWFRTENTVVGGGTGFSLALVGAGYIVGMVAGAGILLGAVLAWFIGVPLYGYLEGVPADMDAYSAAITIWNTKIRIIGVGAMIFGGLWMIVELVAPIRRAVTSSLEAMRQVKEGGNGSILRTERDIPILYVAFASAFLALPLYIVLDQVLAVSGIDLGENAMIALGVFVTLLSIVLSFFAASISSYMSGLLGNSNNPLSGVLIMVILVVSLALLAVLGSAIDFSVDAKAAVSAAGITVLITAVIACVGAVSGDNLQDLKSGQVVGATPWKQQVMLILGVLVSALILAPIFGLLFEAYGFGDVLPHEGMDPSQALSAPKAALLAALAEGIFTQTMEWTMIMIGGALAVVVIIADKMLVARGASFRLPVLGVAVGMYMPLDVDIPLVIGALLSVYANRSILKQKPSLGKDAEKAESNARRSGLLFASGLIAGEALVGIFLAIPFAAMQSTNVFNIVPASLEGITDVLGLGVMIIMVYWFYVTSSKLKREPAL